MKITLVTPKNTIYVDIPSFNVGDKIIVPELPPGTGKDWIDASYTIKEIAHSLTPEYQDSGIIIYHRTTVYAS